MMHRFLLTVSIVVLISARGSPQTLGSAFCSQVHSMELVCTAGHDRPRGANIGAMEGRVGKAGPRGPPGEAGESGTVNYTKINGHMEQKFKEMESRVDAKLAAYESLVQVVEDLRKELLVMKNATSCPTLQAVEYGSTWECTNGNFIGSVCKVTCLQNRFLKKENPVVCKENRLWSPPTQGCVCKDGWFGDKCENSASWRVYKRLLRDKEGESVAFAGHHITCLKGRELLWSTECTCTDETTGKSEACSRRDPCACASAKLIKEMVREGTYTRPLDYYSIREDRGGLSP